MELEGLKAYNKSTIKGPDNIILSDLSKLKLEIHGQLMEI